MTYIVSIHDCSGSTAEAIVPQYVVGPFSSMGEAKIVKEAVLNLLREPNYEYLYDETFISINRIESGSAQDLAADIVESMRQDYYPEELPPEGGIPVEVTGLEELSTSLHTQD